MASDDKVRTALDRLDRDGDEHGVVEIISAHIDHLTAEVSRLREWSGELNVLLDTAKQERDAAEAEVSRLEGERDAEAARLDFIERTFSGMTNRERYLPVQMVWGKGAMGRTLREACDKYMKRAAIDTARGDG